MAAAADAEAPPEPDAVGDGREPRRSRAERIALGAFVVALLVSLGFWVHPWYEPMNDGSMYIATARSLAAGEGYTFLGAPFLIRPPGFSLMLAPILALRGTDFFAINLFVSLWGVAGVLLLFAFLRPRLGWVLALLSAAAVWTNPGYQRLCTQVMSDVPGTTLLLACLLLDRRVARRPTARGALGLGLFVGLTTYVRSMNALVIPAILVSRLFTLLPLPGGRSLASGPRPGRRAAAAQAGLLLAGFMVCLVPWMLRNRALATPPPADQTLLYSYGSGMWNEDMGDPGSRRLALGEVLERFDVRSGQIAASLGNRMVDLRPGAGPTVVTLLLLAALVWVLLKRREPAEIFALGALAVIAVYFGFASRLLLPIYVLALPAAVETLRDLAGLACGRRGAELVAGAALAGLLLLDFAPRKDWDAIEAQHRALSQLANAFEEELAPDARLASARGWHYAVYLDRPVYSVEFAVRRAGDLRAAEAIIDKYDLNTVVLSPLPPPPFFRDREVLPYFRARYEPKTSSKMAQVFRVRP